MVIIAEDSRFKTHHGIDFVELREAWAAGGHRGASTITQQLAKNLYLSPSRSVLRKLKEAVTAVRFELALPKERIMELYLGVAEWGPGVWGADAASRSYFGVPVSRLSNAQAAAPRRRCHIHGRRILRTNPHACCHAVIRSSRAITEARLRCRITEDSIPDVPEIEPPILPVIPLDSISDSLIHQP
jgi:hypothetical protein